MLSYGSKSDETYIDATYLWRCMKIDQLITLDAIIHKLGCASYSNIKQNEMNEQAQSLIDTVNQKIDEIANENPVVASAIMQSNNIETPSVATPPINNEVTKHDNDDVPIQKIEVEKTMKPPTDPKTQKTTV